MKIQVEPKHYASEKYNTKERFNSYFYQIKEVISYNPKSVLEIGVGNSFVSEYLKKKGLKVTTLDCDENLNPDKVGSVLSLPFLDSSFELVICFQVLEHLPYDDFTKALKEIYRVTKRSAILSLPDVERCFKFFFTNDDSYEIKKYIEMPRKKKPIHLLCGEHHWEIGKDGYPLGKICNSINSVGFEVLRTYRIFENTYHRIFVLNKSNNINASKTSRDKCRLGNLESWRECYSENNLTSGKILKSFGSLFKKLCK